MQPTNPILVLKHLLPVPIRITFDKSYSFWISQHPFPFSPMHPKSCAQSINKKALYYLHTLWVKFRSAVSESIEKRPSVITNTAFYLSFSLTFFKDSTIASWSKWGNLITFPVAALAPYCKQLWESLSIIIVSFYFTRALITPKPASHPAE